MFEFVLSLVGELLKWEFSTLLGKKIINKNIVGDLKNNLILRKLIIRKFWCFLVLAILCCSTNLVAQNDKVEIVKIENTVTMLYNAMVEKDKNILEDLTLQKLTYGHSSGTIENKSEYVDGVLNGAFQFTAITPIDQSITIAGDVGVVRHIFKGEGLNSGTPAKVNIGSLLIFKKKNNNWKLLARQAFKL